MSYGVMSYSRKDVPYSPALATCVDLCTDARTLVVLAAGQAVAETRRSAVVGVVGRHVTSVTSGVRLHLARTAERARVALEPPLSAPAHRTRTQSVCRRCHTDKERRTQQIKA